MTRDFPRIFVTTSDKYLPALRPFYYLLNKYWVPRPEVVVIGFSQPAFKLPDNFTFRSMGRQTDYPVNRWSNALQEFLQSVDDEAFILMLEDYWITRAVDTRSIKILYDYMLQFRYVIKMDLCGDRLYAHGADLGYGTVAHLDLIKSMPGSPYHMSLMAGIWSREHMLRVLVANESPWDLEIVGTDRLSHIQDVIVLGTRQWPLRMTLGLRGGDHSKINLDELSQQDVHDLTKMGYFQTWGV